MFSDRPPAEPTYRETKEYEQRRAGLREADPAADKKVLDWKNHVRQKRAKTAITDIVEQQVNRALRSFAKEPHS